MAVIELVVETILRTRISGFIPWMLTSVGGAFYGGEPMTVSERTVSTGTGTLRLALYVVLIGGAALAVFHRRDVT